MKPPRRRLQSRVSVLLAVLGACTAPRGELESAGIDVDLAAIDRRIPKEPVYAGRPLYALLVFGERADELVWAVLDRATPDAGAYSVLYLDRNGNGDLTEPGERYVGACHPTLGMEIYVGDLPVSDGRFVHTRLTFNAESAAASGNAWFRVVWCDRALVFGGYNVDQAWSSSPESAPVFRPTGMGPLSFALEPGPLERFVVGGTTPVHLRVGNAGSGSATLCAVHESWLDPIQDPITLRLVARDRSGGEISRESRIDDHC